MAEIKRRGISDKCPACGSPLDDQAYRCPKCRIYFCYKCRARVTERDTQYQCANQACSCYGKLLCAACVTPIEMQKDVPNADMGKGALAAAGAAGLVALVFGAPVILAAAAGVGGLVGAHKLARKLGFNSCSTDKTHKESTQPMCCIECKTPAKHLR